MGRPRKSYIDKEFAKAEAKVAATQAAAKKAQALLAAITEVRQVEEQQRLYAARGRVLLGDLLITTKKVLLTEAGIAALETAAQNARGKDRDTWLWVRQNVTVSPRGEPLPGPGSTGVRPAPDVSHSDESEARVQPITPGHQAANALQEPTLPLDILGQQADADSRSDTAHDGVNAECGPPSLGARSAATARSAVPAYQTGASLTGVITDVEVRNPVSKKTYANLVLDIDGKTERVFVPHLIYVAHSARLVHGARITAFAQARGSAIEVTDVGFTSPEEAVP